MTISFYRQRILGKVASPGIIQTKHLSRHFSYFISCRHTSRVLQGFEDTEYMKIRSRETTLRFEKLKLKWLWFGNVFLKDNHNPDTAFMSARLKTNSKIRKQTIVNKFCSSSWLPVFSLMFKASLVRFMCYSNKLRGKP